MTRKEQRKEQRKLTFRIARRRLVKQIAITEKKQIKNACRLPEGAVIHMSHDTHYEAQANGEWRRAIWLKA